MRIAMVSDHASPLAVGGNDAGGQSAHVAGLSRELAARGHEVVVYTRRDAPALDDRVELCPGVTVEHLRAGPAEPVPKEALLPYMPVFAEGLATSWARFRPHVVHSHFWMSGHAALKARRGAGVPIAHTFHELGSVRRRFEGPADKSPRERVAIEIAVARHVDYLLSTSTEELLELRHVGVPAQRSRVVPCGVDLARFRPTGEVEMPRSGASRIVALSRLLPHKGIDTVLRALAALPGTELVVGGGPSREDLAHDPDGERLLALTRELGLQHRVELRGRIPTEEVPALLRSADVVVAVPWYEPFGLVPLEAMACGVPVVVTPVGGMADTVLDGITGVHVPPRDPDALAAAVAQLLENPARRHALGARGAERARQRFGWGEVARQTLDAYTTLVGEQHAEGAAVDRASAGALS